MLLACTLTQLIQAIVQIQHVHKYKHICIYRVPYVSSDCSNKLELHSDVMFVIS